MRAIVGAVLIAATAALRLPKLPGFGRGGGGSATLPPAVQTAIDARYVSNPTTPLDPAEISALWRTAVECYGSEEDATRAVEQNPFLIHPLYTASPDIMRESKAALLEVLTPEEALDVMLQNPAVLQCGESLSRQPASEIKRFAALRSALDKVPPSVSRGSLVGVLALTALAIASKNPNASFDPAATAAIDVARPVVGAIGAVVFAAVAYNAARNTA